MDFFSKNPQLSLEKLLVFGALGLYVYKFISLKKAGQLSGEPDMLVKIDKKKVIEGAAKQFKLSKAQHSLLSGVMDALFAEPVATRHGGRYAPARGSRPEEE